ncbi:PAS domain-containing protein [Erythrobacter sp. SDW2]|uniref:sensor histidine kinase n=1 Tax=Erythrobacter sp. SDW2 TaxID=2907154 RepID=UPI001F272023|nr:PAS domain-containing protein [Erythrobacter sp. SDW2]UIP07539.1 PAS domain-containing protein [Erythrobacter sp. SDW2]
MKTFAPSLWPAGTLPAPAMCDEDARLKVLAGFGLDSLVEDEELAQIASFAGRLCNAPIALVSIVEEKRQRFLAGMGLDVSESPRETSFCAHAMLGDKLLVVSDARSHPLFADNPLVTGEPHIRFYAGAPLITSEGAPLGSLCVIDRVPRSDGLDSVQCEGLTVLARAVMRRLEAQRGAVRGVKTRESAVAQLRFMLDSVPTIAWSATPDHTFDRFNARWYEMTGSEPPTTADGWRQFVHPDDWDASARKFAAAVASCSPLEDQWRLRRADGTWRWVLSRALPSGDDPATALWFGTLTDIDDNYREGERMEILANELAHRIKNIFAVMNGLIALRSRNRPEAKAFADELSETVRALGRAQDYVMPLRAITDSSMRGLLAILTAPYGTGEGEQVHITGDRINLAIRAATPLALIFHELATNSAKYGALSVAEGRVEVTLDKGEDVVRIGWVERGGPAVSPPSDEGFGSRMLRMSAQSQLNGAIEHRWLPEGLEVNLTIPLGSLES